MAGATVLGMRMSAAEQGEADRRREEERAIANGRLYRALWSLESMNFGPAYFRTCAGAKKWRDKAMPELAEQLSAVDSPREYKTLKSHLEKYRDGRWRTLLDSQSEEYFWGRPTRPRRKRR